MSDHPEDNEPTVVELKTVREELRLALHVVDRANKLLDIHTRVEPNSPYVPLVDLIGRVNRKIGELTP